MKLLIASDLHGSALYCRQLLEAFQREQADRLLFLGDILYHGPRNDLPEEYAPKQVIALLNPLADRILCVRGNCDAEVDQMVLDFPVLAEYALLDVNGLTLYATHGHHLDPQNPPKLCGESVLLGGHTHIPAWEKHACFWYLNPGSVSMPKEGSQRGYLLLEDRTFSWITLKGQIYHQLTL